MGFLIITRKLFGCQYNTCRFWILGVPQSSYTFVVTSYPEFWKFMIASDILTPIGSTTSSMSNGPTKRSARIWRLSKNHRKLINETRNLCLEKGKHFSMINQYDYFSSNRCLKNEFYTVFLTNKFVPTGIQLGMVCQASLHNIHTIVVAWKNLGDALTGWTTWHLC